MFETLEYILFAAAIICVISIIYNIICFIHMSIVEHKNKDKSVTDAKSITSEKHILNIWLTLTTHRIKKKIDKNNDIINTIKKTFKNIKKLIVIVSVLLAILGMSAFIYGMAVHTLNTAMKAVTSSMQTLLNDSDECTCWAKCYGDDINTKTSFELIFGPDAYKSMEEALRKTINTEEFENYEQLKEVRDGKADVDTINQLFINNINDEMVEIYKRYATQQKYEYLLWKRDGNYRSKMTNEQLEKDLLSMFAEHHIDGKNPDCIICHLINSNDAEHECNGIEHWKKGWSWSKAAEEDIFNVFKKQQPEPGPGPGHGPGGTNAENSQYGIKLDDGWYYWYQQSGCSCPHNVNHETYGRYSEIYLYHPNKVDANNKAKARGCSTYSTAMAISNALGMEVTPYDVLTTVLGGTITPYGAGYEFGNSTGRGINLSVAPPEMSKSVLTASAVQAYGSYGLKAQEISKSKADIDKFLDEGYYIVFSFQGPKSGTFQWYDGDGHFIVLRKHTKIDGGPNDLYYCLDSNVNDAEAFNRMTSGVKWSDLSGHIKASGAAYWGPGNVSPPGEGDYDLTAEDEELIQIFKECGASESKAYGMLACYKAATEAGLSSRETVGLLGCAMCEGTPGLIQYGFRYTGYDKSLASKPVYADTIDKVNTGLNDHTTSSSNASNRGTGTAQWTNGREVTYLNVLQKYVGSTPVDHKTLWKADYEMYKNELNGGYKALITDMKNHNSSVESILVYSWARYEAGWGNYKGDSMASYSGKLKTQLDNRYPNAVAIDAAFRAHAK